MEDDYLTLITTGIKRPPEERWKYVDVRKSLLHRQFHILDKNLEGSKKMYRDLVRAGIISEYERDAIEHCNGSERGRKFLEALMKKDDNTTLKFLTQCKEGKYGRLLATLATDMFESELYFVPVAKIDLFQNYVIVIATTFRHFHWGHSSNICMG